MKKTYITPALQLSAMCDTAIMSTSTINIGGNGSFDIKDDQMDDTENTPWWNNDGYDF